MNRSHTRRAFVKSHSAAGMGILLAAPSTVRGSQANSAMTVGLVGCGRRGPYDADYFTQNLKARLVALCDIYEDQLAAAERRFPGRRVFRHYEELLASNVDAVLLATPPSLRPEQFEAAVEAKKHIFMEKPVAVNTAGCRRVLAAAENASRTTRISVGFQQRYGKDYRRAREIVRSGGVGKVLMVRGAWMAGDLPLRKGHPASEERMRNWLFYREMSGDIVVEQDCHNIDVVNWFLDAHPVRAFGYGGRRLRRYGDILDSLAVTFEYPGGIVFSYSANQFSTRGFLDIGETFIGEKGAISTSRQGYRWFDKIVDENLPPKGYKDPTPAEAPQTVETGYDITQDAVNEFIEGVLAGHFENAAFSAVDAMYSAIMAREAIYGGKEMTWDEIRGS